MQEGSCVSSACQWSLFTANSNYSGPRDSVVPPPLPMDKWVSLPPSPISLETLLCVHITAESWKQGVLLSCWHVCRPWVQVTEGVCNSSQDPHLQMLSQRWILASSHSSSQLAPGLHQSVRRTLLGGLVAVGFVLPSARGSGVWQEPTLRAGP